jgi:hypothetical protein
MNAKELEQFKAAFFELEKAMVSMYELTMALNEKVKRLDDKIKQLELLVLKSESIH